MQLDVLRRRSDDAALATELERIQGLLRHEVLNLRELMQTMRPVDIGPHQFLDFIADLVERFSRDTGIACTIYLRITRSYACRLLPVANWCESCRRAW